MIKHILVPTDGSEQARIGMRYAIAAAKRLDALIHGLFVIDSKLLEGPYLRDISASLGQEPFVNHQGKLEMILEERGKAAMHEVESACGKAGVECKTEIRSGMVASTIIECSELCDIVVMGRRGEHSEWLENLLGSTTEAVARRAPRPIIVTGTADVQFDTLLAAYDGSDHAKNALHFAASLTKEWSAKLVVVTAGTERAEAVQQQARDYLDPHELPVEYRVDPRDAGNAVIEITKEVGAGLAIIGAYGHNIIRERILGSTTTYILNHSSVPVLMVR